jgi:hypothetical protein
MLQSKAGYIDARPHIRQLDETLLRRTAGPYIRVIRGGGQRASSRFRYAPKATRQCAARREWTFATLFLTTKGAAQERSRAAGLSTAIGERSHHRQNWPMHLLFSGLRQLRWTRQVPPAARSLEQSVSAASRVSVATRMRCQIAALPSVVRTMSGSRPPRIG